jgi:hypothetical protein
MSIQLFDQKNLSSLVEAKTQDNIRRVKILLQLYEHHKQNGENNIKFVEILKDVNIWYY